MASDLDSRTQQFGLRDFLFYLVPGSVGLAALFTVFLSEIPAGLASVGGSVAALLGAYFLGQVLYLATYPVCSASRWFQDRLTPPPRDSDLRSDSERLERLEMAAIEGHMQYYATVVFRDRSFARFSLAMVVPTVILGICVCARSWRASALWATVALLGGVTSGAGFLWRHSHYERRFHAGLLRCEAADSKARARG